jgi:hypothetical protein
MQGERELTVRALLSGVLLGALLTPCNVYSGLKIGWSFNMSITASISHGASPNRRATGVQKAKAGAWQRPRHARHVQPRT